MMQKQLFDSYKCGLKMCHSNPPHSTGTSCNIKTFVVLHIISTRWYFGQHTVTHNIQYLGRIKVLLATSGQHFCLDQSFLSITVFFVLTVERVILSPEEQALMSSPWVACSRIKKRTCRVMQVIKINT